VAWIVSAVPVPLRQCRADPRLPPGVSPRRVAARAPGHSNRKRYIGGATPEQAAEQVQTQYWNTRSFERMRKR
jgi:hypothetical protein